jgi:ubiquinone/menaquinone biosynthesis C-methylase UbiE
MTVVSPRDAYRVLAAQYDSAPNALVSLEQRVMSALLPAVAGSVVADCGAGTGRWASHCARLGARAVAVDFSLEMLSRVAGDGAAALAGDLMQIPLSDGCSDLTICAFAVGYAPGCLGELARITRTGGVVLMSDMHPDAVRAGWTRTFRHGDDVIHVAHERYEIDDLQAPGLKLDCLFEPKFGDPERDIFERAGHGHRFEEASREPAIFVARWLKV